jgi:hypothetical protein
MLKEDDFNTLKVDLLNRINEKFDELDILLYEYLVLIRNRGGTLGFCVGSIKSKINKERQSINTMCGKLSEFKYKKKY